MWLGENRHVLFNFRPTEHNQVEMFVFFSRRIVNFFSWAQKAASTRLQSLCLVIELNLIKIKNSSSTGVWLNDSMTSLREISFSWKSCSIPDYIVSRVPLYGMGVAGVGDAVILLHRIAMYSYITIPSISSGMLQNFLGKDECVTYMHNLYDNLSNPLQKYQSLKYSCVLNDTMTLIHESYVCCRYLQHTHVRLQFFLHTEYAANICGIHKPDSSFENGRNEKIMSSK